MKQLLLGRNGKPVLEEYQEMPLQAGYVRVVSDYGAPKHGTELHGYEKDPFAKVYYDENTHIFRPREKELVYEVTPCTFTASGKEFNATLTRFCTITVAISISVPTSKVTVSE